MAEGIPVTRRAVPAAEADAIREAVRRAERMSESRLARPEDAAALLALLSDPAVHAPIYSLPRPLTEDSVRAFIEDHQRQQAEGTGLLFVNDPGTGDILGYSDIQVWPDWAAGEIGGAIHPSLHGKGTGTSGAARTFSWMFEMLGLDLICETASLENVITQRLLDGLGFRRMGQVTSTRPDGTMRESLVWEITAAEWRSLPVRP
ncbi:MAG: GNAT family N-acetyltransferase [Hyphomonas sp.]